MSRFYSPSEALATIAALVSGADESEPFAIDRVRNDLGAIAERIHEAADEAGLPADHSAYLTVHYFRQAAGDRDIVLDRDGPTGHNRLVFVRPSLLWWHSKTPFAIVSTTDYYSYFPTLTAACESRIWRKPTGSTAVEVAA